jgi:hypothetical protein
MAKLARPTPEQLKELDPRARAFTRYAMGAASGVGSMLLHPYESLKGTVQQAIDLASGPFPFPGTNKPLPFQQRAMERIGQQASGMKQQFKEDPLYVLGQLTGPALLTEGAGEVTKLPVKGVGELRRTVAERFGPKIVPIAGQKVPVLVGEAAPETSAGRFQVDLKKAGIGGKKFDQVSRIQQEAVKQVIRNVAQRTTGMIGPMAAEPGVAVADASQATFAQARPMFEALDASAAHIPDSLSEASKITEQAISRARKLGVTVDTEGAGGSVTINGRTFTPGTDPVAWENLKAQGLASDVPAGQPITTYIKVRSQLLKMQRATADPAMRNAIGDQIRVMNDNMDAALKGTPLHDNWTEANRLWTKGYALRDVADAIIKRTTGTPAAEQAPGISPVPTRVQGAALVKRLNELQRNGTLRKAFTPQETANLRQAVDILDRASGPAGRGGVGLRHSYSPRSLVWRAIMRYPAVPLVNAMTTTDGLAALRAMESAKSGTEAIAAVTHLGAIAAATGVPRTAGEAKARVQAAQTPQ